ncbi:hypothetical protein C8R45DRAFT_979313 [Mycena sanguinolenta]|nr:hypothetical protein C8R45DRAFT_979313 [Mycena sanguinolenta]
MRGTSWVFHVASAAGTILEYIPIVLCCPCVVYLFVSGWSPCGTCRIQERERKRRRNHPPVPPRFLPDPPPLPSPRIDIRMLPVAEHPESCYFFKLPLELRKRIYEQVFVGRIITLQVAAGWQNQNHSVIRSHCYLPSDDLAHGPTRGILPAKRISVALLRSCRQVYSEALPMLHQRNTWHIWASQLEPVVRCGLGEYSLPDIHSVYIYYPSDVHAWPCKEFNKAVFAMLRRMNLRRVAFELEQEPEIELDFRDVDSWGRCLLGLANLERFELWFNHVSARDPEAPENSPDKRYLAAKLRKLMIGPGADERKRIFLDQYDIGTLY